MEGAAATPRIAREIPDMPLPSTSILSRLTPRPGPHPERLRPMKLPRYVRLLPSVVVVGTALLVLKTSGLVHEAYAEAPAQKSAPLTNDPVPANADYAGGADDEIASASEVNVVNALAQRRKEWTRGAPR